MIYHGNPIKDTHDYRAAIKARVLDIEWASKPAIEAVASINQRLGKAGHPILDHVREAFERRESIEQFAQRMAV